MFKQDFTLHIYSELLNSMKKAEYEFQTLEQFVKSPKDKVIIIRHDVDRRPFHSLAMANIEVEYGIYSSYYFRIINSSNNPVVIREIVSLGHEIGYHYEDLTLSKGNYTKLEPNKFEVLDIKKGILYLNKLNAHNHTQGIVVRNNSVIAKETSKGTKKMLQTIKRPKNSEGILIKFPKKKQDLRADLPTIGLDTLRDCKKVGIKGILLKSKKNIILDKNKSIRFANNNKIFISVK